MAGKSVREWIYALCAEAHDSPLLDNYIEMSITLFSSKLKASTRNYGIALGTLHLMQPYLDTKAGTVNVAGVEVPFGAISNLKEGDLSISLSAGGIKNEGNYNSKVSLTKTKWGESLWELISSNAIFMGVATGAG